MSDSNISMPSSNAVSSAFVSITPKSLYDSFNLSMSDIKPLQNWQFSGRHPSQNMIFNSVFKAMEELRPIDKLEDPIDAIPNSLVTLKIESAVTLMKSLMTCCDH